MTTLEVSREYYEQSPRLSPHLHVERTGDETLDVGSLSALLASEGVVNDRQVFFKCLIALKNGQR